MGIILSVDDDHIILELLTELFTKVGLELITADNSIDAIEIANTRNVDVAILDISLPHIDGFELQQALRQLDPFTRIIFLSSQMNKKTMYRAMHAGAVDFHQKPFLHDELVKSVLKHQTQVQNYRKLSKAS
ncbi:MAG: response regulator [Candidatus Zixiibacteriota bacterium]